ncbi:MAG: ABC transporter permease [Phycisphaerales bacterium]|nr:MAG: ABC transporter permease [Phycisphaerales bacterium]
MAMTDFTIISRSLTSRWFSTVTTIVTVAVAVALMIVLLSMRTAGQDAFQRGAGNMHMLVSAEDSALVAVLNSVFYASAPRRAIPWSKYLEISEGLRIPWEFAIPNQQGDSYRGFPVLATTEEFFTKFQPHPGLEWSFRDGRRFERPFEVVIGSEVAQGTGLRLGDEIYLTHGIEDSRQRRIFGRADETTMTPHVHDDYAYRVVGILEQTGSPHDRALFTDLISTWVIHAHDVRRAEDPSVRMTTEADLRDADRLITGIYLRVGTRPGRAMSAGQQQIYDMLRRDTTITVADPHFEIQRLFRIVSNIDQIFIGMAGVVLLSSGIAIMLALYNTMEQRRRQIAILRVLGCSRPRIFGLVLTESALIGLLGALAGVVFAFIGMIVVAELMKQTLGLVIEPRLEPVWTFVMVMASILLAALAGLVPAAAAYRTTVVAHLRPLG